MMFSPNTTTVLERALREFSSSQKAFKSKQIWELPGKGVGVKAYFEYFFHIFRQKGEGGYDMPRKFVAFWSIDNIKCQCTFIYIELNFSSGL